MQNKTILCVFAMEAMTNTRTQLICSWTIDRWIFHYYLQRCSMEQTEQSLADYERKIYLKKSDVNLVCCRLIFMAHERMKSHSNVDDDVCVECCVVLHTLNAKPTTSATAAAAVAAEKNPVFIFQCITPPPPPSSQILGIISIHFHICWALSLCENQTKRTSGKHLNCMLWTNV